MNDSIKIKQNESDRLSILRFPLIMGVIYIHAYGTDVGFSNSVVGTSEPGFILQVTRDSISLGIARLAVPLFFLISGYLFFLNFEWSLAKYTKKIKSRINTLLIPFLFWNIITLIAIYTAQTIPATQMYFSGLSASISSYELFDYLNALIGINKFPVSYQFWFIRDLMVLVLMAPLLFLSLKKYPVLFLALIFVCWFLHIWPVYIPSSAAILFFYIGSYMAFKGYSLFSFDKYGYIVAWVYPVILVIDVVTKNTAYNEYIHKVGILLGIITALYLTSLILNYKKFTGILIWLSGTSFFVYACHEPLLTIFKKISYKVFSPESDMFVLVLYLFIPIIVASLSVLTYVFLKAVSPRFLNIISGGR